MNALDRLLFQKTLSMRRVDIEWLKNEIKDYNWDCYLNSDKIGVYVDLYMDDSFIIIYNDGEYDQYMSVDLSNSIVCIYIKNTICEVFFIERRGPIRKLVRRG